MGWHVPNLGSYVLNQFQYTAHLTVGLNINDLVLVTPDDFRLHRCTITSHIHTKNRFAYTCQVAQYDLTLDVCYFLVQEHVLGCKVELQSALDYPLQLTCYLTHLHTHNPHTSRLWEHGWYALANREDGHALLGLASEGDAFLHGAHAASATPLTWGETCLCTDLAQVSSWARGKRVPRPHVTQRESETGWQKRALALPCTLTVGPKNAEPVVLHAALVRGVSLDQAHQFRHAGLAQMASAYEIHLRDDEQFWRTAPQLRGDWPASWRRGFVYDLETLRMTMRQPCGVLPHVWDGMQVQAPRTVLAEAAMDVLYLSYADPDLAADVILGHFESSPRANLPCMREDGSYNMVADDGQICGTAPEWGYPLWCCDELFRKTGDLAWLKCLYPRAAAYLRWWLAQRRDNEGWLTYACSWESGQDVSSRFGPQQTGGTIIQHVRPVDLQASMAQGALILARWAELLASAPTTSASTPGAGQDEMQQEQTPGASIQGDTQPPDYAAERAYWQAIAAEFTEKTRQMWRDGWFRDYDAVARVWSSERDAMHLAPIFCGIAEQSQIEQLRPALAAPPQHSSHWAPLSWPPVVMTLIGASAAAGMHQEAAELAAHFIDGSYRSTDSRELDEHGGLPGVTREYRQAVVRGKWGETDYINAGIEGYGWGALSLHLLIHHLLGVRTHEAGSIEVAPMLPVALRKVGTTYEAGPLSWGRHLLHLSIHVRTAEGYHVLLRCSDRPGGEHERVWEWDGVWGNERVVQL